MISSWEKRLLEARHFNHSQVSKQIDAEWALRGLVNKGYLDAFGSTDWNAAMFSITTKGEEYLKSLSNPEKAQE